MSAHESIAPSLTTSALAVALVIAPRPAWGENPAEDTGGLVDAGLEIGLSGPIHFSPTLNGTDYATAGAGIGLRVMHAFGEVYALGIHAENFWLHNPSELDVTQQDLLLSNRFWLAASTTRALGLEVGLGITRYSGGVDIPETAFCYGCGKYDGATVQPALHTGLVVSQQVHRYVLIQTGARLGFAAMFMNMATDKHDFVPGLFTLNLDSGIAVPFF